MLINVVRPVPPQAIPFVQKQEGLRLTAYPDPISGREPWTIGWGSTHGVAPGMAITEGEAVTRLQGDLLTAGGHIEGHIGEVVSELTDNQYAALLSLAFNCGTGPEKGDPKEWQLWRLLCARQFDQIPGQIIRFCNAGGRKVQDLVNRRSDEVKLWSTDEPGSTATALPSSTTRVIDTPPTDMPVKPLSKSKSMIGSCVAACLASASAVAPQVKGAVDGATSAIAPYVGQSTILQGISSHLALVAAAAALAVPALLWLKNHEAKSA